MIPPEILYLQLQTYVCVRTCTNMYMFVCSHILCSIHVLVQGGQMLEGSFSFHHGVCVVKHLTTKPSHQSSIFHIKINKHVCHISMQICFHL